MNGAIPRTTAAVALSDRANAAQVVSLQRERMRRAKCPGGRLPGRVKLCPLKLMMAVTRERNVSAAARSLGFTVHHAHVVARKHRFGRYGDFYANTIGGRMRAIPPAILHRSPVWLRAYREARDAALAAGWNDGWATYTGIRAADAWCVGGAG